MTEAEFQSLNATREEFLADLEQAKAYAAILVKDSDRITPALLVNTTDETRKRGTNICALHVPFNTADERQAVLFGLGKGFMDRKEMPTTMFLITEAWHSTRRDCEPKDDPDRREVVVIFGLSMNLKEFTCCIQPLSRVDGKFVPTGPFEEKKGPRYPVLHYFIRGYIASNLKLESHRDIPPFAT